MSKESTALVAVLKRYRGKRLVREVEGDAALLCIAARRYARIQVRWCNEDVSDATRKAMEATEARLEKQITDIVSHYDGARVDFGGDPRGYTVKLHLPPIDGRKPYNSWGGEENGYGIGEE